MSDKIQKTKDEANSIIAHISEKTKEIISNIRSSNEFKNPFEFSVSSDTENLFEIYIKGNRKTGTEFQRETWKKIHIVKAERHKNYPHHPVAPNEYFVSFSSFGSGWGVDNPENLKYMEDGTFEKSLTKAIKSAITDFTEQNTI